MLSIWDFNISSVMPARVSSYTAEELSFECLRLVGRSLVSCRGHEPGRDERTSCASYPHSFQHVLHADRKAVAVCRPGRCAVIMGLLVFAELLCEFLAVGGSDVALSMSLTVQCTITYFCELKTSPSPALSSNIYIPSSVLVCFGMFAGDPGLHIAFFIFERQCFLRFCTTGENESRGECACRQ